MQTVMGYCSLSKHVLAKKKDLKCSSDTLYMTSIDFGFPQLERCNYGIQT